MLDFCVRDYEGYRVAMIKLLQEKLPEYTDTSQSDAGIVLIELIAHMLDLLSYYVDIVANEMFLETAQERSSVIALTRPMGYTMSGNTPSKFYQVFQITPQATDYTIPKGTQVKTKSGVSESSIYFETDADLVIPAGMTGLEKVGDEYTYKVSVTQGYSITGDVLGSSNGTANQQFKVNYYPVIEDSFELYVNESSGFSKWIKVDNFIDSVLNSTVYLLSTDENDISSVSLGDGVSGKIPQVFTNGILANYRVGGGSIGNVGQNTITELEGSNPVIVKTFNPSQAYVLGVDKESIEVAKNRAIAHSRTLWRAVTLQDYKDLAIAHLNARKAVATLNAATSTVTTYILPQYAEVLTNQQITDAEAFFAERQIMGFISEVSSPSYVTVDVTIVAKTDIKYSNASVKTAIENKVQSILAVGNYDFGQDFILSDLIAQLVSVEGVKSVSITSPSSDAYIASDRIVKLGSLSVTVTGGS